MAVALSSCAVGPDFETPAPPTVERYTKGTTASPGNGQRFRDGAEVSDRWWEQFRSPRLNGLVEDALQHNSTIEAAQAAMGVAHYNAEAGVGPLFPLVGLTSNPTYSLYSGNATNSTVTQAPFSLYTKQVQISYTLDIWGGARRNIESLDAQAENQAFLMAAAQVMIAANVTKAAIEEASLRAQIAATRLVIGIEAERLGLLQLQFAKGAVSSLDLLSQETALAQARQRLPALENLLAQQRDLLTALAGRFSQDEVEETFALSQFSLPRDLPVSLPARLVGQRPDIRAAEASLHSASAQVGVALAARLPSIQLTAAGQTSAFFIPNLFQPGTFGYQLAGNAAFTAFDAFTLQNKQKAAEAGLDQAKAQYRDTVVKAFQNVADSLHALQSDARAVAAAHNAESAAQRYLGKVRLQQKFGSVSQLVVVDAQRSYLNATLARVRAEAQRLSNTVALYAALGGGWTTTTD
ncbi:histidine kinase [Methylocystis bryophila]|uniref:Histidine kinase n=2 Tax=Methylocystis bryophila TaxID=655015 RepID=A0A1W6N0W8_9HYPH|nr:histidine kinase [Methylocystis bryophila]